jgi:hypothetical protein
MMMMMRIFVGANYDAKNQQNSAALFAFDPAIYTPKTTINSKQRNSIIKCDRNDIDIFM